MVAGVLFHAIAGTNRARADVSTVGLGSVLGIVALLLVVFRS
jgi:predicted exporter